MSPTAATSTPKTPGNTGGGGTGSILDQGNLSDGTPYVVRVLEEPDIPSIQNLDQRVENGLTKLDKKFFYAHNQQWYEDHLRAGNKIIGMFNASSGALISKANLTVDCARLDPTGLNATSALRKTYAGQFGKNGIVALLSGIGTDSAYQRRGAQSQLLRSLFKHAQKDCNKVVMAAIVEPRNITSLSVLSSSGMEVKELNNHPVEKADYFLLSGMLHDMQNHIPITIKPDDLKQLNGTVDELRIKIKNSAIKIAAPLDIEDRHANNLYNSDTATLITYAFQMGYSGTQVVRNPDYDPQDKAKGAQNYLIMELHF